MPPFLLHSTSDVLLPLLPWSPLLPHPTIVDLAQGSLSFLGDSLSARRRCHFLRAPRLEDVYSEIHCVLRPGALNVSYSGSPPRPLTFLDIAPKGVVEVHQMLYHIGAHLSRGDETGILTPMYMILCRKPT